jgi:hypothetical protein
MTCPDAQGKYSSERALEWQEQADHCSTLLSSAVKTVGWHSQRFYRLQLLRRIFLSCCESSLISCW